MAQFGSILRHFGIRYGYYDPKNDAQCRYIDPIIETFGDQISAMAKLMFVSPETDKAPLIVDYVEFVKKYNGLMEKNLEHHGGKFAAGDKVTIADFVMASYIGNYLTNPAFPASSQAMAILAETPKFQTYTETVKSEFTYL